MLRPLIAFARGARPHVAVATLCLAAALAACSDEPTQPAAVAPTASPFITVSAPVLAVSDSVIDFGSLVVGQVSDLHVITVTNVGIGPLTLGTLGIWGENWEQFTFDFSKLPYCTSYVPLNTGQSCYVGARFAPKAVGPASAMLSVESDGGYAEVRLRGSGVTPAQVSPQELLFDNQVLGTNSLPQTIQVKNLGTTTLKFTGFEFIGLNAGDFALVGNANTLCQVAGSVAAGATCDLLVIFKPTAIGSRAATLNIKTELGNTAAMLYGVAIGLSADVGVGMAASVQGKAITYAITVKNAGPDSAWNVALTDTIPAGTTLAALSPPSDMTCFAPAPGSTGVITCGMTSLAVGASRTVQLTVKVVANTKGSVKNKATIMSTGSKDPVIDNNTATVTTVVGRK